MPVSLEGQYIHAEEENGFHLLAAEGLPFMPLRKMKRKLKLGDQAYFSPIDTITHQGLAVGTTIYGFSFDPPIEFRLHAGPSFNPNQSWVGIGPDYQGLQSFARRLEEIGFRPQDPSVDFQLALAHDEIGKLAAVRQYLPGIREFAVHFNLSIPEAWGYSTYINTLQKDRSISHDKALAMSMEKYGIKPKP